MNATQRLPVVRCLGVPVANVTMAHAIDALVDLRRQGGGSVAFLNAHCANVACRSAEYRAALEQASLVFGDGSGVRLASRLAGTPIVDNVNGTDMAPLLFDRMAAEGLSLYLLGARPGVARAAAEKQLERHPGLQVAGADHGYHDDAGFAALAERVAAARPDVILVALGVPRQELWIERWRRHLAPSVLVGVGGLLDFLSERIPRAPGWLRFLGLEWTYRLWQEPGRMWRRYLLGNVEFMARVMQERLFREEAPCEL